MYKERGIAIFNKTKLITKVSLKWQNMMSQSLEREPQCISSVNLIASSPATGTKVKCNRETRDLKTAGFYLLGSWISFTW